MPYRHFETSQFEILVRQSGNRQLGGAWRYSLQGVVPKGPAVGTGGHDPPFGADYLIRVQLPSPRAVSTAGLNRRLKQIYDGSAPFS